MVLRDDHCDGLLGLQLLLHRENDGLAEILARRIHHRDLAARTNAGVNCEDRLRSKRRRKKQMPQVLRKHLDCRAVGLHLLLDDDIDLAARRQESLVRVFRRQFDLSSSQAIPL